MMSGEIKRQQPTCSNSHKQAAQQSRVMVKVPLWYSGIVIAAAVVMQQMRTV